MQDYTFKISEEEKNLRIDLYLVNRFNDINLGFSRAFIQKLIRDENITVDGRPVRSGYKLKPGELVKIVIPPQPEFKPEPENIPLEIVYEDSDILVVNKSRDLVVHPAAGNLKGTLVNALLFHCKELSSVDPNRPGIVHRLDKDTAGLLVVAKNNAAHLSLTKQFSKHSIKRTYLALVVGKLEFDEGVVDLPIGRHPIEREKMSVNFKTHAHSDKDKGRKAYTRYRTIKRYNNLTFVELIPQTGRTHQLRVHMAAIGNPILGDATYGRKDKRTRLALFAKYLGLIHPGIGKFMDFEKHLPSDMQDILDSENE